METGYVAVLVIELHFPEAGSLKAKRKDLQSIKAVLHGRFGCAVAETAHHDLWQRSTVTAALTSGSLTHLSQQADTVERWLDARAGEAGVRVERIVGSLDDLSTLMSIERRGI
jgi:hypothetical protein